MNFFADIKISHKLGGLMIALTMGFILIGVAYFMQLSTDIQARKQDGEGLLFLRSVENTNVLQLKMRELSGRYFFLNLDHLNEEHNRVREQLTTSIGLLKELRRKVAVKVDIESLEPLLAQYDKVYDLLHESLGESEDMDSSASVFNTSGYQSSAKTQYLNLAVVGKKLDDKFGEILPKVLALAPDNEMLSLDSTDSVNLVFTGLLFMVALGAAIGMFFVYKSIAFPLFHMQNIIRKVNHGNLKARVGLNTLDELGDLGRAFNKLLDERIQSLESQVAENDKLNNSIIALIRALGVIAQKDLTIKVPVSSDITGTISDAVNLLTSEMAKTLSQVIGISRQVDAISGFLQDQSTVIIKVAEEEKRHVTEAGRALDISAKAMNAIAGDAESANKIAENTIETTHRALHAVTETVTGIKTIRDTISETEKRIKRLGERSQEITGIVNLINTIAERTHILALNASMHAASAGEAGKGFAVVAEEVQRLAENARNATSDISSMVNNIRIETSDTVATMNRLISEVAEGTKLAEVAGNQMAETESSTRSLVDTVRTIFEESIKQAKFTGTVRNRATAIRRFTEQTGEKLIEQKNYTESLKSFSQQLVDKVTVFTLPAELSVPAKLDETIAATGMAPVDQELAYLSPSSEKEILTSTAV